MIEQELIGKRVLIVKGSRSGSTADVAYVFYRHKDEGFCQMEPKQDKDYEPIFWVVPCFDHCGRPKIEELHDGDFVVLKKHDI